MPSRSVRDAGHQSIRREWAMRRKFYNVRLELYASAISLFQRSSFGQAHNFTDCIASPRFPRLTSTNSEVTAAISVVARNTAPDCNAHTSVRGTGFGCRRYIAISAHADCGRRRKAARERRRGVGHPGRRALWRFRGIDGCSAAPVRWARPFGSERAWVDRG